ncbi:hypothetical protein OWV82_023982 [Melia azedarach]|uniref:Uncharacterized protein n=1 Tax=Melia azedarach TaxID=155640 RepID=A0ACC1WP29_MELAZ|nr:hypothetical protein OWV82_023982 [Melia azedarach]
MDQRTNDSEVMRTRSFGRTINASSSLKRRSLSLSGVVSSQIDDEIESETVSEAGDIGDRALHSNRHSESGSLRWSIDNALESGLNFSIPENDLLQSNTVSTVTPLPGEITSPISPKPLVGSEGKKQEKEKERLPKSLEYTSCLAHLAVFGILGVLTRYLLQKLFGPSVADVTNDHIILYPDLPSNMVGSFLMGWFGVVFKGDLSNVSDYLAIGLSTGYLGSLTTFSGWNQKMLELSLDGQWVSAFVGFVVGLFLAAYSIIFGVEIAKGFRWLLLRNKETPNFNSNWRVDSRKRHFAAMLVFMLMLAALWILRPFGVWIRWFLARLNGRGIGKAGTLKWVPFGTLIANVSAAWVMAALATVKKAVDTRTCDIVVTGMQFGFLGCLSTVSTFIAEFNAMRQSTQPWRAYAYAGMTIIPSFCLGTLIHSVPVWIKGYN